MVTPGDRGDREGNAECRMQIAGGCKVTVRFFEFFFENLYLKFNKKPMGFLLKLKYKFSKKKFKNTDCNFVAKTLPDTSPKTASTNIENCKSFRDLSDVHFDENAN